MKTMPETIRSIMFNNYSFIIQIIILLIVINMGYPFYEEKVMRTFDETEWVTSPNGVFQVKALHRGFLLHRFVQLKVKVRKDMQEWPEIANVKVFTLPFFTRTFKFLDLKWKDRYTLLLGYYSTWTTEAPYELRHKYYSELVVK